MSPNLSFDWTSLEGQQGTRLIQNPAIQGQDHKTKVFSFEPYAQNLFNLYMGLDMPAIRKDLDLGDLVKIQNIYPSKEETILVELQGGLTVDLDLNREKKFVQIFGYEDVPSFMEALKNPLNKKSFLEGNLQALVTEIDPVKISLWQGHLSKTQEEFMREIDNPTKAYVAKVMVANRGGYFVEVQGVSAFMPGSLAAPNKILDFKSLLNKEIVVMIEDYIPEMKSFIVSHKKYIDYVLPTKIRELDMDKMYGGRVTGTSKYGIFIEFEEIFTGLLHVSKMTEETLEKFQKRLVKPQDPMDFFIGEITRDNRIILTEENPMEKKQKIEAFVEENKDKILQGEVAALMEFGIIVNYGELSGLIPLKEFKNRRISMKESAIGDKISVTFSELRDGKILFRLPKFRSPKKEE